MPDAEARYIRRIGDYVIEILPETPRRQRAVLRYVSGRLRRRVVNMACAATAGGGVLVGIATIDMILDGYAAQPTRQASARIIQDIDNTYNLEIVRDVSGQPMKVIHRKILSLDEARVLMTDPDWQERVVDDYASH